MKNFNLIITLFFVSVLIISCDSDNETPTTSNTRQFGIFKVLDDDTSIEMDGTINSSSLTNFNNLVTAFSSVNKINIKNCDGSSDDTVNLQLSEKVHQKNINIHLMDNGDIASGGVDFFLAGIRRTKGTNTRIGVHSWSDGTSDATEFPVGHANHLPYINYYVSVGFTQANAEAFYYFTINAASASSLHWMTDAEITQYGLLN